MLPEDDFEGWYVVQTRPQWEARVVDELAALGLETYLPIERKQRQHARKTEVVERPFFPRYLFAYVKVKGDFYRVKVTLGVERFLTFDGRPRAVPGARLDILRAEVDKRNRRFDRKREPKAAFRPGENVRITAGPFGGFSGVIERGGEARKKGEARTFHVWTALFGRLTLNEIEASLLESLGGEGWDEDDIDTESAKAA